MCCICWAPCLLSRINEECQDIIDMMVMFVEIIKETYCDSRLGIVSTVYNKLMMLRNRSLLPVITWFFFVMDHYMTILVLHNCRIINVFRYWILHFFYTFSCDIFNWGLPTVIYTHCNDIYNKLSAILSLSFLIRINKKRSAISTDIRLYTEGISLCILFSSFKLLNFFSIHF